MIVVSDTSPLSGLFFIDQLHLLEKLYGKVVIPKAVMTELLELEKRGINLSAIKEAEWIEVVELRDRRKVDELSGDLDIGEAESIVLAGMLNADWLLIDEAKGRSIAKTKGLQIVGLLGILLLAKEQGIILSVKSLLDGLMEKAKFRLNTELYNRIIAAAGE
jgi:predicted nucleic acid-binding protein